MYWTPKKLRELKEKGYKLHAVKYEDVKPDNMKKPKHIVMCQNMNLIIKYTIITQV